MLITPRTYQQVEVQRKGRKIHDCAWSVAPTALDQASRMLLVHQVGAVRIGEVVRYTIKYTPSFDLIHPPPTHLHVKIRNTSAIPLRAAYLVGPYTLYAASYPSTFDPNNKSETVHEDGAPDFEPNLKAGGTWNCRLTVPERFRDTAGKASVRRSLDGSAPSVTWIVDIASQVIFSTSAAVHYELLIGRDQKSVELGPVGMGSRTGASPGKLEDYVSGKKLAGKRNSETLSRGLFSSSIGLTIEDTESLWNKPSFPTWDTEPTRPNQGSASALPNGIESPKSPLSPKVPSTPISPSRPDAKIHGPRRQKKVHLVVLTHGLHSNLGADMLFLKESIDAAAKQARQDRREKRQRQKSGEAKSSVVESKVNNTANAGPNDQEQKPASGVPSDTERDLSTNAGDDDSDEEEVIVRGFSNNACRTERGIQYLGKRLAKWVLSVTYPDQEYLPQKRSVKRTLTRVFTGDQQVEGQVGKPPHNHSTIYHPTKKPEQKAYKITSISFVAHSLGGLTQTYAIAYIHKHSPNFFSEIRPINFVAMAAPFLGLSNENPLYVRFALDFGLVGRTGQDLGLAWRAPTMVRSGWGAMIGGLGAESQTTQKQVDPGSKPLLRILPTGHTHQVLKLFRNRTIYSNVVNDGIVPLRTSCLLFLDWSGLGRVEKARRESGLIGTTLGWGWAELTGANSSARSHLRTEQDSERWSQSEVSGDDHLSRTPSREARAEVPQPTANAVKEDNTFRGKNFNRSRSADTREKLSDAPAEDESVKRRSSIQHQLTSPLTGLMSFLRPNPPKSARQSPKHNRIYRRGQTMRSDLDDTASSPSESPSVSRNVSPNRPGVVRGNSFLDEHESMHAPPKTSFFESAGDVLNPPLPPRDFIVDPDKRPRTIFHDRVYQPTDIPPPPVRRPRRLSRSSSNDSRNGIPKPGSPNGNPKAPISNLGDMKVEEKIARAYHHGLAWRKVLVRLEPDAHNNMVVRRMFANAYGWPVVKHLVDTHFADTFEANTADVLESSEEQAGPVDDKEEHSPRSPHNIKTEIHRTDSEMREAVDSISDLQGPREPNSKSSSFSTKFPTLSREDSARWDDTLFDVTDESEDESAHPGRHSNRSLASLNTHYDSPGGTSEAEITDFLTRSPLSTESPKNSSKENRVQDPKLPSGSTTTLGLSRSPEEQIKLGSRAQSKKDEVKEGALARHGVE